MIDVAVRGHTSIDQTLLRHGANPNARSDTRGPVLHCAVERANVDLVALLLAAGADPRYHTEMDESALDAVPPSGIERETLLELLAKHGVEDPRLKVQSSARSAFEIIALRKKSMSRLPSPP